MGSRGHLRLRGAADTMLSPSWVSTLESSDCVWFALLQAKYPPPTPLYPSTPNNPFPIFDSLSLCLEQPGPLFFFSLVLALAVVFGPLL